MKRRKLIPAPVATYTSGGSFDLASIMVGIIVIGLIGGVIAATVFAIIPLGQDTFVKNSLITVQQEENRLQSISETKAFTDLETLVKTNKINVETAQRITFKPKKNDKGDIISYTATMESPSGKVFTVTSESSEVLAGSSITER